MTWLPWVIGYYIVSRILLITGTVLILDSELTPANESEPPMLFLIAMPISGEVMVIFTPFIMFLAAFAKFGEVLEAWNKQNKARRATKVKLLALRDLQVKLQEAELDKELEQARQDYNKRGITS